jgi:hypothetical protein
MTNSMLPAGLGDGNTINNYDGRIYGDLREVSKFINHEEKKCTKLNKQAFSVSVVSRKQICHNSRKGRRELDYIRLDTFNYRLRLDYDSNGPDAPNGLSRALYVLYGKNIVLMS